MGDTAIFEVRIITILFHHSTAIDSISHPCLSFKKCVRIRSFNKRKILGGWFYVIINIQPLIIDKGNVFWLIRGGGNVILNRVTWGRWWGSRILDLWWRRGRIFVKETFRCPLLPDYCKHLGTIEGLPGDVWSREENGFVWKAVACHLGLMFHTYIFQSLHQKGIWMIRTDHCRRAHILENHITLCSLDETQP